MVNRTPMWCLLIALCSLAACSSPGRRPAPSGGGEAASPSVHYGTVYRLDGRTDHLSRFAQDRLVTRTGPDGRAVLRVEPFAYLLLVVSHSECEWGRKLLRGLASETPRLRERGVRVVGLLREKTGHPVREWAPLERGGITLVEDRGGACYDFYVRSRTPVIKVIDAWGNVRLSAEGYIEPATLVRKIRDEDFRAVPPGAG